MSFSNVPKYSGSIFLTYKESTPLKLVGSISENETHLLLGSLGIGNIFRIFPSNAENKRFNFVFESDGTGNTVSVPGTEIVVPFTGAVSSVRVMAQILSGTIHVGQTGLSASISFEDTEDSTGATVRIATTGAAGQSGSFQGSVNTAHATVTTVQHGGRSRCFNPVRF